MHSVSRTQHMGEISVSRIINAPPHSNVASALLKMCVTTTTSSAEEFRINKYNTIWLWRCCINSLCVHAADARLDYVKSH